MNKIIVVDSVTDHMSQLYELLDPLYDITLCINSIEALSLIRSNEYDLVMINIMLPQMDGFDMVAQIKKLDYYQSIPIILAGESVSDEDINKGFFLGASEFIAKPYNRQLLLRRIKDQLIVSKTMNKKKTQTYRNNDSLANMYKMLENLCEVIESKDYSSGVHIMRSGHYYKILVHELMQNRNIREYFGDIDIDNLVMAAKMHDIGKIATPDHILNKPGSLTKFEFETMKNHSYNGYHILKRMSERLEDKEMIHFGEQIALSHHEKWNGKGYPSHLKHEEIPLPARIMAIVDVYDALTSKRVYKKSLTHEKAMDIISKEKGESFDPIIVDAFIKAQDKILNTYMIYSEMEEEPLRPNSKPLSPSDNKVLLVESDPITREIMGNQLSNSGFSVSYSASGIDAIMMLKNRDHEYSFVLSDIRITDMDGYEFIQLLRNVDPKIVAFCVVEKNYSLISKRAEELGFDGCFMKPLDCDLLLHKFNHVHNERQLVYK